MERVLILDGATNAGRAVLQSLGRAGYCCVLASTELGAPAFASRHVQGRAVYPDPLLKKTAFQDWLIHFHRDHQFDLIIAPSEATIVPLDDIRGIDDLERVSALPPRGVLDFALDKEKTREVARDLGIPIPETLVLTHEHDLTHPLLAEWLLRGPVVLKPTRSKRWNSERAVVAGVQVVRNLADLKWHFQEMRGAVPLQAQAWVPGTGMGIELLLHNGEVAMEFAHERLHEVPLTGGGSSYRRAISLDEFGGEPHKHAVELLKRIGWNGVAMIEFRADKPTGRSWLIEINGRFWGSLPLAVHAGADFPKALAALHFGRPLERPLVRHETFARNLTRDLEWTKAVFLHGERPLSGTPKDYEREPTNRGRSPKALASLARVVSGKEAWDGVSLDDPGPLVQEVSQILLRHLRTASRKVISKSLFSWVAMRSRANFAAIERPSRVLVLCHGNICRSPYAAQELRARLEGAVEIRSAGMRAVQNRPCAQAFVALAGSLGVDLSSHRAARVTQDDVNWADLILIMESASFRPCSASHPGFESKAVLLGAFHPMGAREVPDPNEVPPSRAVAILEDVTASCKGLTKQILSRRQASSR